MEEHLLELPLDRPHPFRLSVTGIDGVGKDTVTKKMFTRASRDVNVVTLGRPAWALSNGEATRIFRRTTDTVDRAHEAADKRGNLRLITAVNALTLLVQTRIMKRYAENMTPSPDIIASARDPRVDPTVYLEFYARSLSKRVSVADRLRTMQRLTAVQRHLIILLTIDPRLAVERIDARIQQEEALRQENGLASAGARDKWRHMHENVSDLTTLSEGYNYALTALQEITPTPVITIETSERTRDEVADVAYSGMIRALRGHIEPGEAIPM